jgi:DNA-binding NtrC family response regulator
MSTSKAMARPSSPTPARWGSKALIGGREVAMIFADVRLPGAMGGVDLAWEVKLRWPLLPMILTSGHPLERIRELPPGVAYMPKPWQPLNVLIATKQALAFRV